MLHIQSACLLSLQGGISGCGASLASRVALYGLGDQLLDIAMCHSGSDLDGALAGWRDDLRRAFRDDPKNIIGRRFGSIASKIDSTFLSTIILHAYANPLTSALSQHVPQLNPCRPDLIGLASFCFHRFGWSPRVIHAKFEKHLWRGVCVQTLLQVRVCLAVATLLANYNCSAGYLAVYT